MKFLIIDSFLHHKNEEALHRMVSKLGLFYNIGNEEDIIDYDIIYMPSTLYDVTKYPDKKFIFGPHLSVFPTNELLKINNVNKNSIYIQPSEWAANVWKNMGVERIIPIRILPFCVNTEKFKPIDNNNDRDEVFIYTKRRNPKEISMIENFLNNNKIKYRRFDYVNGYKEEEYINCLKKSKFGIIIDAHESQGFAIEEALSCNVPLLVWNTKTMNQEYGSRYKEIECSTIPYWDESCGEYFYDRDEFNNKFILFKENLLNKKYKPREFILKNLHTDNCANRLKEILNSLK